MSVPWTVVEEKPVTPIGVGRKDYSENVEFAVEPQIRSYQSLYAYNTTRRLGPLSADTFTITVPSGSVAIIHDIILSVPANVLIGLDVVAVEGGVSMATPVSDTKYQIIAEHRSQGYPAFETLVITLYNYSSLTLDFVLNLTGFQVSREQYYQAV